MRRVLNVRSACSLPKSRTQKRPISRCSWMGGAVGGGWWMRGRGRSLSMMSHVFVLLADLYNQRFRFVHSITKKQGTLVMAITHPFMTSSGY